MLGYYSNEFHIEALSLSRDLGRIAQCFFRDCDPPENVQSRYPNNDHVDIESLLAALAEECQQIPALDVVFVCGISDSESTWKRWLEQPASFEQSVAELSSQLENKVFLAISKNLAAMLTEQASNHWLIVISQNFEALVLVETLCRTFESKKCNTLESQIVATIFLNAPEFSRPPLSKPALSDCKRDPAIQGKDVLSSRLARSVWKFQRQQWPFRRIGISKEPERGPSQMNNGFDPTVWLDAPTTRLTPLKYILYSFREMSDCLFWTIARSIRGHRKLQFAISTVKTPCNSVNHLACPLCIYPSIYLERLLLARSPGKRQTLLRVLRWVAYSLRPLEVRELLVAVSTTTELDGIATNAEARSLEPHLGTQEDLLAFCDGLLSRSDQGTIRFVHEPVRDFVQSPAMRALDVWGASQVHEMIAVVCLRHITCLDETAVLRPWVSAGKQLLDPSSRCYLGDYSALHWHQHFRLAESTSMYLPSLLYQALQAAFRKLDSESGIAEGFVAVERRIDQGLQFCCRYDFVKVGRMFFEMGAKIDTREVSPIHVAAAFGSVNLLKFLIESRPKGNEYEELSEAPLVRCAYSPIELAALHGRTAAVEFLLLTETNLSRILNSDWTSAFIMAVEYGHQEVVKSFLKYGTHPGHTRETDDRALRLAKELGYDGIVELISASGSITRSDLNPQPSPVDKPCIPVTCTSDDLSQDTVIQAIEPGLLKLDICQPQLADMEIDLSESDELEDWSMVEYTGANYNVAVYMDVMDKGALQLGPHDVLASPWTCIS